MASILSTPLTLVNNALFEPALTGPLLLASTRSSPSLRSRVHALIGNPSLQNTQRIVTLLKWLFGLGLASHVNTILNTLALNHWRWAKQGAPWNFSAQREICVVTGGAAGFGLLIAQGLVGRMRVVVLDVVAECPAELQGLPGLSYYRCDITKRDEVAETAGRIREAVGVPSVLINNAGVASAHTILDTSEEFLEKVFRVNLLSHWTLIKEFLPGMLEQRKGHIVSLASMASYLTTASIVDYTATKAGVLALHEGLNQELKHRYANGRCIQTSIVHPMWAQTALVKDWQNSLVVSKTAVLPPAQVADAVVKQVLSGKSGQVWVPERMVNFASVKGWPHWTQEFLRDGLAKATAP